MQITCVKHHIWIWFKKNKSVKNVSLIHWEMHAPLGRLCVCVCVWIGLMCYGSDQFQLYFRDCIEQSKRSGPNYTNTIDFLTQIPSAHHSSLKFSPVLFYQTGPEAWTRYRLEIPHPVQNMLKLFPITLQAFSL